MSVNQTQSQTGNPPQKSVQEVRPRRRLHDVVGRWLWWTLAMLTALLLFGGSALPANEARLRGLGMTTAGWGFDLVGWEVDAVGEKIGAFFAQPARDLSAVEGAELVRTYMARAVEMVQIEGEINRVVSASANDVTSAEAAELQAQLEAKRAEQQAIRQTVEQVIQGQIGRELVAAGFALGDHAAPPVQFTFTEPPKKMVVSPRDRIETVYTRMLAPEIDLATIEQSEQSIADEHGLSGYITNIGGLGAFPTMVIDRASLPWVLSTVAHEWVHNYLAFFPLGWHYFSSGELTTINESVAEIVGNEIGERALRAHFPELVPPEEKLAESLDDAAAEDAAEITEGRGFGPPLDGDWPENPLAPPPGEPPRFDFRAEMRQTRLEVDRLLAEGKVEQAEAYMERRRQFFVEQGYALRVLNQAYFAFHGSYGTSAASTSPIGPKLERLRQLMPDVRTFLVTVRSFTTPDDLDAALLLWEQGSDSQ